MLLSIISNVEIVSFASAAALADFAFKSIRLDSSTTKEDQPPRRSWENAVGLTEQVEDGVGDCDTYT